MQLGYRPRLYRRHEVSTSPPSRVRYFMSCGSMIGEELRIVRFFFLSLPLPVLIDLPNFLNACQITDQLCRSSSSRARVIENAISQLPLTQRWKWIRDASQKKSPRPERAKFSIQFKSEKAH